MVAGGGDDILALKDNQEALREGVEGRFLGVAESGPGGLDYDRHAEESDPKPGGGRRGRARSSAASPACPARPCGPGWRRSPSSSGCAEWEPR